MRAFRHLSIRLNELLGEVQCRDDELKECRDRPEEKVAERTAELRALNTQLVEANQKAEEAGRVKGESLASISQEVRTRMNGIIGMTELALDTQLDPEQRQCLEMVKTSAASLLGTINDILDSPKIESGRL